MRGKVQLFLPFRLLQWVRSETISNLVAQAKGKIVIVLRSAAIAHELVNMAPKPGS
jgi:hypothetical protein